MVKAIETVYDGCRFRSRLEARWAVLFDALKIRWQYEPEGFEVGYRLSMQDGTFKYLPDFWLPDLVLWVEVKGHWSAEECSRFLDAVAFMSDGSCRGHDGQRNFLICGPFVGRSQNWPWHLHMHKGDVYMSTWSPLTSDCGDADSEIIATDFGGDLVNVTDGHHYGTDIRKVLLNGSTDARLGISYATALNAARQARFEHGESGALS